VSVANAADELLVESAYQTSALFFFTDKILPCIRPREHRLGRCYTVENFNSSV